MQQQLAQLIRDLKAAYWLEDVEALPGGEYTAHMFLDGREYRLALIPTPAVERAPQVGVPRRERQAAARAAMANGDGAPQQEGGGVQEGDPDGVQEGEGDEPPGV